MTALVVPLKAVKPVAAVAAGTSTGQSSSNPPSPTSSVGPSCRGNLAAASRSSVVLNSASRLTYKQSNSPMPPMPPCARFLRRALPRPARSERGARMEVETAKPASREAYARKLCTTCSAMLRNSGAGCSAAADSVSEGKAEMAPPAMTEPEAPLAHGPLDVPRWSTGSACDVLVVSQARRDDVASGGARAVPLPSRSGRSCLSTTCSRCRGYRAAKTA
mmetsp:Transcript_10441/g.33063  ORF Transcript_10441/g.33063 Transcript_10441/m.33063 type:complete len:219 (+) Transcript_10441:571-1227(+)